MSETNSPVLNLQNDVIQSDCDVVNVLRKAHVIATKLDLDNFDSWVRNELYGYTSVENIPRYRHVRGQLKAVGLFNKFVDVVINDKEVERKVIERDLTNSISELISFLNMDKERLILTYPGELQAIFKDTFKNPSYSQFTLHISKTSVYALVDAVKTTVLEWTLVLEKKNILGNGMTFSSDEKKNASIIPQTINNYYGPTNIIGEGVTDCQVIAGNNNQANFSYEYLAKAMSDVQSAIDKDKTISEDDKDSAKELIAMINSKIEKQADPGIIKGLFQGLKGILVNALGGVAAGLILSKIQGLF